ncbi:hypothetical protein VNI00_004236 [Paramarasmius palmivorus]|uniref:Uncharacterized protein n=1 Tax=Paramarasmius palmivorus TaxID=297713 RepID=A0AAW0DK72_9AGAR
MRYLETLTIIIATLSTFLVSYSIFHNHRRTLLGNTFASEVKFRDIRLRPDAVEGYSFEGDDYPSFAPIPFANPVRITMEESVHYTVDFDPNITTQEWLYNSPHGSGIYRLGSKNRAFYVAMYHYLHCLRRMHAAFMFVPTEGEWLHLQHCLNSLRQAILCQADATLEVGDFATRNFEVERFGATHTCHDVEVIYNEVQRDWLRWRRYMKGNDLPEWLD